MVELSQASDGTARVGFGGDIFNTAAYLSRLGQPTAYLTALGDDPYSTDARALLTDEGIDASACPTAQGRTMGLYAIRTDARGERSFTCWRDRSPARDLFGPLYEPGIAQALHSARLVYLSGISLWLYDAPSLDRLSALLTEARAKGVQVAFDGNYRPRLWGADRAATQATYARMLAVTDICLATADDEALLWGDTDAGMTHHRLTGAGVAEVVVKCGAEGALIAPSQLVAAMPNRAPIDTTAAGDSFNAGYLDARLKGHPPEAAAAAGNRLAGRVIRYPGALIPRAAARSGAPISPTCPCVGAFYIWSPSWTGILGRFWLGASRTRWKPTSASRP
jgi:2-dehydro-3-deoxygluconokinase